MLFGLIDEAKQMLQDRSDAEAALIYHVAKLDNEERCAIILAYQSLKYHEKESKKSEDENKCQASSDPADALSTPKAD